jgi:hypothetical protein
MALDLSSGEIGLATFLLTQFGTGLWWASKQTQTLKEVVITLTELRTSMREGMFPSCVRHTHEIKSMQADVSQIKVDVTRLHERIDAHYNGSAPRRSHA